MRRELKLDMNTNTRSVSFVENLQLEISDSLFNESILLADVDNDEDYELVVGQINGDLLIFKGSSHRPWRTCHHLGMITCVEVGDLWNQGENLLFCITAEGWCHIFDVTANSSEDRLEPVSSQLLPSNCKVLLLADVDGDGSLKLVTGHADRVVHVHKLQAHQDLETGIQEKPVAETSEHKKNSSSESSLDSQATSKQNSPRDITKDQQTETPPKKEHRNSKQEEKVAIVESENKNEQDDLKGVVKPRKFGWQFVSLKSWTVPYQINSLVVFDVITTRYLLASQPGGTYVILMSSDLNQQEMSEEKIPSSPSTSIFNQLPVLCRRNKGIPTNLITLRCHDGAGAMANSARLVEQDPSYLVLCNQDGHLIFMNENKHYWSLRVDQGSYNLFALSKLDITGDGNEELAICSWDGITYIVDHLKNVVQFKFGENVLAFSAGYYAFSPGKNLPALVYVTSSNRIVVYWNARLSAMVPTNLDIKIKRKASQDKESRAILGAVEANSVNNNELAQLYKQCLYGKNA